MIRIRQKNINTVPFWDHVWEQEPDWHDGFGFFHDRYRALTAGLEPPAKVLDVGGGRGEFLDWLGGEYDRTLFDHSRWAVELALSLGRADRGVIGDCLDLPFGDESFDATFCAEVLEHVEEPQVLINELRRVTRPGGLVGISTPYANTVDDKQHVWAFDTEDITALFWAEPMISIEIGPTIVAVARA